MVGVSRRGPHLNGAPFSFAAELIMPTIHSPYLAALARRVLVFDGAMGTSLQRYDLSAADFGGEHWWGATTTW